MVIGPAARPRERGFTFLEVMVCTAVSLTLCGALLLAGSRHLGFAAASFDETVATHAAAARLEEVRAAPRPPAPGKRAVPLPPDVRDALPSAWSEETVREAGPGLFEVEVAVSWRGAGGGERRAVLTTLVADGGGR